MSEMSQAEQSILVVQLATMRALRMRTRAGYRVARSVIEGQLAVLEELGFGGQPTEDELLEVARAGRGIAANRAGATIETEPDLGIDPGPDRPAEPSARRPRTPRVEP